MINRVNEILSILNIPINWNLRPQMDDDKTVISYHFFNEKNSIYGDGKGSGNSGMLQIDVFSVTDYSGVAKNIIDLMVNNGFKFVGADDYADGLNANKQLYHKKIVFNYLESEVK